MPTRRWWPATAAQNNLSPNDVALVDLQPQAILAVWERGDIAAAYTWLPTLDDLRKTGKDLITSRQLAKDGKPTLDLGAVSDEFAAAHPCCGQGHCGRGGAQSGIRCGTAAAASVPDPEQLTFMEWLGTDGAPGNIANNLESASQFLAEQKQIPTAAPLKTFQDDVAHR